MLKVQLIDISEENFLMNMGHAMVDGKVVIIIGIPKEKNITKGEVNLHS